MGNPGESWIPAIAFAFIFGGVLVFFTLVQLNIISVELFDDGSTETPPEPSPEQLDYVIPYRLAADQIGAQ